MDEHVLVMRAVENADKAGRGKLTAHTPQKIVALLGSRRHLERVQRDALRVGGAHHVTDDAALARGVHRLQHEQDRAIRDSAVRVETLLQIADGGGFCRKECFTVGLLAVEAGRRLRVDIGELEAFGDSQEAGRVIYPR